MVLITNVYRYASDGDESRLHFRQAEGSIPTADELEKMGIRVFMGGDLQTTGSLVTINTPSE
jgi:hypothetical protein